MAPPQRTPRLAHLQVVTGLLEVHRRDEDTYRDLHAHPDLSHQEIVTPSKIAVRLRDSGYEVHEQLAETARGVNGMVDNDLKSSNDALEVVMAQYVLLVPDGLVETRVSPTLSAGDSRQITTRYRRTHGSMPQALVGLVVLGVMIVVRLLTVASQETQAGESEVAAWGITETWVKSNVIPNHTVIEPTVRPYSEQARTAALPAIGRIVKAECEASDSRQSAEFGLLDRLPITDNDITATERVVEVFTNYPGDRSRLLPIRTTSESFCDSPKAFRILYTYWCIGEIVPKTYIHTGESGKVAQDIPLNYSANFAPVINPTIDTGTRTLIVRALAWPGKTRKASAQVFAWT